MKYIKVYESWVNEAESAKLDVNKPQAYPMLKLTQGELYTGNEENLRKTLASLYSRGIEKKEISETDPYSVVNFFNIKITSVDGKKGTMSFKFAKAKQDVSLTTDLKVTAGFESIMGELGYDDVKSEASLEKIKNAFLVYPKTTDKSKVITKSEDNSIKVLTESAIIIILPTEPYDKEDLAINLLNLCIAKGEPKDCVVGQSSAYIALEFKIPGALSSTQYGDDRFFANKIFKKA